MDTDDGTDKRQEVNQDQSRTIFALSSGSPPAGIGVVRISGPSASDALRSMAGRLPVPRRASYSMFRNPIDGATLDRGLSLWFPGPNTATGEDLAELHLHGGRAVVTAILAALSALPGLYPAAPGEFTRRAFDNGRIDLAEAEGLADLLSAETPLQHQVAMQLMGGHLSRQVDIWQRDLLNISASVEALLDFSDEGDVAASAGQRIDADLRQFQTSLDNWLARPPAERLKDGIVVAIAGPVNAGKSSLINALAQRDVAIASSVAGTTRDLVEAHVAFGGIPFRLIDTAGIRETDDVVERMGIERARDAIAGADLVIWLGKLEDRPTHEQVITVTTMSDLGQSLAEGADLLISSATGEGIDMLIDQLTARASSLLPREGEVALNARHRAHLAEVGRAVERAADTNDLILVAEELRFARRELDAVTGRAGVEEMLDTLFGRFCIGK